MNVNCQWREATRSFVAALMIVFVGGASVAAKERKLRPVDEAGKDVSFKSFRDTLMKAIEARDTKYVLSTLDPKIHLSFGGSAGIKDFKEMWKPDDPKSELWNELGTVLSLGGTFDTMEGRREFCAPYTFTLFPSDLDAFNYGAVIGENVRVRAQPNPSAPIIATLSYDIVRANFSNANESGGKSGWVEVVTPAGKRGYVSEKFIRSPVDYRACFRKTRGKWLMTTFIAGD